MHRRQKAPKRNFEDQAMNNAAIKETWDGTPKGAMRVFLENDMWALAKVSQLGKMDVTPELVSKYTQASLDQIDKIARESYPLYQVTENSDIVLHAEGPGAEHNKPTLTSLNWLTYTAEKNIRSLISATLDLFCVTDGKNIAKNADLRLSGIAPGSIFIGLKLDIPPLPYFPEVGDIREKLIGTAKRLPMLARFIGDEGLEPGIREAEQDPALRDAALLSLLNFSPTGRRGIHTLNISSREHGGVSLSQRERVVLYNVFRRPKIETLLSGSFSGEVRAADLDKERFHLRASDGTMIRCVMQAMKKDQAKNILGNLCRVSGRYDVNNNGQPRLLYVERLEPIEPLI